MEITREKKLPAEYNCLQEAFIVMNIHVTCVPYARNLGKSSLKLVALQLIR